MGRGRIKLTKLFLTAVLAGSLTACGGGGGGSSATPAVAPAAASISGTLFSAASTATDGDTNDPFSSWIPNDSGATAQPITAPVTVGGFVTAAGTAVAEDRFDSDADPVDVYRVDLTAQQTVFLRISDHPGGSGAVPDLDLVLYLAGSSTEAAASRGASATELLTVPADGSYDLTVEARAGASNYLLTIGASGSAAVAGQPEFVLGEVLVRFSSGPQSAVAEDGVAYRAAGTGLRGLAGEAGRTMRMSLPPERVARTAALRALGVSRPESSFAPGDAAAELRRQTVLAVAALRARPDVLYADLNYIHQPTAVPDDTHYGRQWHYSLINLPQAWEVESGGSSPVTVAVVDTGVLLSHPDLAGKLAPGYDFISDPARANDGDGIDPDPDDPGDDQTPGGSSFHGTHVAGTVAAATNNATGVAGCSWGASVMPVRVLGQGGGTSYDIIQGVRYAAGLSNDSGTVPTTPAGIINLSLGCSDCFSATEQAAYAAVRAAGVVLIAAAGNESSAVPGYPAGYPGVVSVAAVDRFKQRAPYSNFGATVDVAAPGGDGSRDADGDGYIDGVLSTLGDDSSGTVEFVYGFYQGTSMAAPHVAGVVALMQAANPGFVTPERLDALLETGALTEDLGVVGRDDVYGHGLIDAYRSVQVARSGVVPTTLSTDPGAFYFGPADGSGSLTLSANGRGGLTVDAVSSPAPWLAVAGSGLGEYTVTVDRSGLADGTYPATITIDYTAEGASTRVNVPVLMQVGVPASFDGDTGYTYVLLIDPRTNETMYTSHGRNRDGEYRYRFGNVAPGSYYVIAGSDSDNDQLICDDGESCGGYPTLGQLLPVQVAAGDERQVAEFVAAFQGTVGNTAAAGDVFLGQATVYRRHRVAEAPQRGKNAR